MNQNNEVGLDPRVFWRALGNFTTGVSAMTAVVGAERVGMSIVALQQLLAMPLREIEEARADLERKSDDDSWLTAAGQDQNAALWGIAEEQQAQIFARFTPE